MNTLIHTFAGNVGVGTDDPGSYSLSVLGTTKADSLVVNNVTDSEVKIGLISMWFGAVSNIPSGWVLCNGQTVARTDGGGNITTPDLRTRFIIGASGDAPSPAVPGQTGGVNSFTMSAAQLPQHNHQVSSGASNAPHYHGIAAANMGHGHNTGNANANHAHSGQGNNAPHSHYYVHSGIDNGTTDDFVWGGPTGFRSGKQLTNFNSGWANAPHGHNTGNGGEHTHNITNRSANHSHYANAANANHTHPISVSSIGGATSISLTNPFYVLAFIMKH